MPFVLSLKDGKNATMFSVRHFEELIDEIIENNRGHVGELKDIIHGLEVKVEELECDFDDE